MLHPCMQAQSLRRSSQGLLLLLLLPAAAAAAAACCCCCMHTAATPASLGFEEHVTEVLALGVLPLLRHSRKRVAASALPTDTRQHSKLCGCFETVAQGDTVHTGAGADDWFAAVTRACRMIQPSRPAPHPLPGTCLVDAAGREAHLVSGPNAQLPERVDQGGCRGVGRGMHLGVVTAKTGEQGMYARGQGSAERDTRLARTGEGRGSEGERAHLHTLMLGAAELPAACIQAADAHKLHAQPHRGLGTADGTKSTLLLPPPPLLLQACQTLSGQLTAGHHSHHHRAPVGHRLDALQQPEDMGQVERLGLLGRRLRQRPHTAAPSPAAALDTS